MKTSKMIAMLEKNPNLKFITKRDGVKTLPVGISEYGYLSWVHSPSGVPALRIDDEWILVSEPVPWQEALQAWAEGKTISCKVEGQMEAIFEGNKDFLKDQMNFAVIKNELIKGIWFIEEGEF